MPILFFLLFIVLPFVELAILLQIGGEIGAANTIALIVGTGLLGGYLAKREGLSVWSRFQEKLRQGGVPGNELIDGLIILVSGALLVTPGVITDAVGFIGLLPFTRNAIKSQIRKRLHIDTATRVVGGFRTTRDFYRSRQSGTATEPGTATDPRAASPRQGGGSEKDQNPRLQRIDITEIVENQART